VAYDAERRLWYADIEVNFGTAYFPFIRLALARYQPTSVPNAHLSNIVLADFMALTPDRWLSVAHGATADVRNVSVFGWTYTDSSGEVEARQPLTLVLNRQRVAISPTSIVEVWVERLDPALGTDFGWKREAGAVVTPTPSGRVAVGGGQIDPRVAAHRTELSASRRFAELSQTLQVDATRIWPRLWNGTVTLPTGRPADARYRLAIAEFEEYITDDATPYDNTLSAKDRRIVFLEYVELT
jgi:hypothetical protein